MKTNNLMRTTLPLVSALALAACGGGGGDQVGEGGTTPGTNSQSLTYSYPANHQAEVPPPAPVVLRFTSDVSLAAAKNAITLHQGGAGGASVLYSAELSPDHQGVILDPNKDLKPHSRYTVTIAGLTLAEGTAADQNVTFTTKALEMGPKSLQVESPDFALQRHFPDGSTTQPVMDFSTFRLQFSQPIDVQTADYGLGAGGTVAITNGDGDLIPASLIVDGPYITVDPQADYLTPGQEYTLTVDAGLASVYGDTLSGDEIRFTPQDSTPQGQAPSILVQKITDSNGGMEKSLLTGKSLNVVPVNGTLLGQGVNKTQASANLYAELASIVDYPTVTPFRIPKGTVLTGSNIDVLIGGQVPAGISSGTVKMVMLSDTTGYLMPNPYSDNPNAAKSVHLFMDVGIATEGHETNGSFTQNILHIELIGTAHVRDGMMDINAVGVVQPNILGQEIGYGVLSFQLKSYEDQTATGRTAQVADTQPPTLQSWMPGPNANLQKPGDPIIFNFNEPLDPESIEGQVTLYHNGNDITDQMDITVDGAAVVIKAAPTKTETQYGTTVRYPQFFDYNEPGANGQANQYRIQIENGLTDIAGNSIMPIDESFTLAKRVDEQTVQDAFLPGSFLMSQARWNFRHASYSPIILAAYPGFPCALKQAFLNDLGQGGVDASRDLANDKQGICAGGFPGVHGTKPADQKPMDDVLPVMTIPNDHPIIIAFNKAIDPATVILGQTFKVEKKTGSNNWESVPGELTVKPRAITFRPSEPWEQNGTLYRYRLLSSGYVICVYQSPNPSVPEPKDGLLSITSVGHSCSGSRHPVATIPLQCGINSVCSPAPAKLPIQTNPLGTVKVGPVPTSSLRPYNDYGRWQRGVAPQAGGPDFVQFFRAGPATNSVLQRLTTQPVSDTNHNFYNDRDKQNVTPVTVYTTGYADFPAGVVEYGPDAGAQLQPGDPGFYPVYDPNGLKIPKNAAKLLSRNQVPALDAKIVASPSAQAIVVGCAWTGTIGNFDWSTPMICPERKFTYLTSSLVAEVTDQVTSQGIKVKIWPALVAGTSLDVYAHVGAAPYPGDTGPQYLRMRYKGQHKNEPITGYITEEGGSPVLKVDDVPLYVDVPRASKWGTGGVTTSWINQRSYPITMDLTGEVRFLSDGRMAVEQWNSNMVDITLLLDDGAAGYGSFFIPEFGSRLNYVSAPIK